MATRKKRTKGGAKGFALLVIIIALALFFFNRNQDEVQSVTESAKKALSDINPESVKAGIESAKDKATKALSDIDAESVKAGIESAKDKASEALSDIKSSVAETIGSQSATNISGLEIPVDMNARGGITLVRTGFTVYYNNDYKTPYWVAWELTSSETTGDESRKNKFSPDPDLPEPRAEHSDYTNSGYDRGHIAPAADMKWSEQAMAESFYMSNICPQNRKLNRDDWNDLEELCRDWAKKYGKIYIAGGPIYDSASPERIGTHRVAVPDRFFKAVLITAVQPPIALGFLFDNAAHHQALSKYQVSVDDVETATGFDFFSALPDDIEDKIEAAVPALPSSK